MAGKATRTNNLGRNAKLPYDTMMPKEDEIEHILNSLDHLLREGFEDEQKKPAASQADEPPEDDDSMFEEEGMDGAATGEPSPGPVNRQPAPDMDEADGEVFDEAGTAGDFPVASRPEPHRLLLSEEMLDEDEDLPSGQPDAVADADDLAGEDMQALSTDAADVVWLEKHEGSSAGAGTAIAQLLQDERLRAELTQRVSADVAARLVGQLPRLVEESLTRRLAELDPDQSL